MEKKLLFMMVKLHNSKGYTMIEGLIVLMILCACMLVGVPKIHDNRLFELESWLKSELVCLMKDSYLQNQRFTLEIHDGYLLGKHLRNGVFYGEDITVTPLMTITKPLTIHAYNSPREVVVKVWLGMGKMYAQR